MLKNTGIGPLHVLHFKVTDGRESKDDLISWMPELPAGVMWDTFYDSLDGAWIPAGEKVVVLQLSGDSYGQPFALARDACRQALAKLTVSVSYEDIYERRMPEAMRSLEWFGRHKDHELPFGGEKAATAS